MIDIIIPCYNSHETIDRCIGSILTQRVLPNIHVTLVNDAGTSYENIIKRYSNVMDIKEITYKENGGPAKARNFGLQNTDKPFVMFMDSDDALSNPFSTIMLLNEMHSDPDNAIVVGAFIEEIAPLTFKRHVHDTSFMHGKMYKREFLQKFNILQNEKSRCNEDVGFNILAMLIANELRYKVKFLDYIAYYWLFNPKSIVRSDKDNYDHSTSFIGFANNLTYVFEELEKRNIDTQNILLEKVTTMQRLYLLFCQKTVGYPQFHDNNLQAVKDYYNKVYKHVKDKVTDELFNHVYTTLPFNGDCRQNIKLFIESLK